MTDQEMQYPIGKFSPPLLYNNEDLRKYITTIKEFPSRLNQAIKNLSDSQLDTPYRGGGWTLRQVVHHVADSHINAYLRFKWALTEDGPSIKPYEEAKWALLPDYRMPVESSVKILEGVHEHWALLMESFTEKEWACTFINPESGAARNLKSALALYAWHSKHHLAHITETTKKFSVIN